MTLWMDNMDNLLVFVSCYLKNSCLPAHRRVVCQAGLFSGVLTAFLVSSSASLKPDPLYTISSQIAKLSVIVAAAPGTIPEIQPDDSFIPSPRTIRVNFLWFVSLSTALLAAAGAMLAKSWCLEYSRQSSIGTPYEQAQRRQHRYNGLQKWNFPEVVNLLPSLLYISIGLFMIGICDYLLDLHVGLAITMVAIFGSGVAFATFTTVGAIVYDNWPFRVQSLKLIWSAAKLLPTLIFLRPLALIYEIYRPSVFPYRARIQGSGIKHVIQYAAMGLVRLVLLPVMISLFPLSFLVTVTLES